MQIFSSKQRRNRAILLAVVAVLAMAGAYLLVRRYASFVFDPDALRLWIGQFGIFAPLVFTLIQAVQVIVAPIPGQVIALVAGYLFGPVEGIIYSLTGVLIGSAIAFSLSKRYGRSFVEDTLHENIMERFDEFVDTVGIPGLIAFVIIPGLPDDAICFLAGLTKWRLRTFMAAIAIGRLPAYVVTVYAGGELADGRFFVGTALIALVIILSVIGYRKQETVRDWAQRLEARFLS
jgi:uncharacterized membrane protein YdjX (TVP38/TMEM64 family)